MIFANFIQQFLIILALHASRLILVISPFDMSSINHTCGLNNLLPYSGPTQALLPSYWEATTRQRSCRSRRSARLDLTRDRFQPPPVLSKDQSHLDPLG